MPLTTQGKILRVLTDQSYHRVGGAAAGQGRRAGAFGDVAQPSGRDCRGPFPRGPLLSPERRAGAAARRCASGARTFPSWSTISSPVSRPSGASRRRRCRRRRWPRSRPMNGRAMSASCATSSSGRSSLRPATASRCIEVDLLPGEMLDNQGAVGVTEPAMTIMGSPLREAREIVRARISARSRSGAFPATSRGPRRSSAWSARRCTGS